MITKDTAAGIALAHREIETAEALLKQIGEALNNGRVPDFRDAFGRQRGLQLGVPSGDNSQRLFDVPWTLAKPIIEVHIVAQRGLIAEFTTKAIAEAKSCEICAHFQTCADNADRDGQPMGCTRGDKWTPITRAAEAAAGH